MAPRIQVADLATAPALRPAPIGSSTFVAPQATQRDTSLDKLSSALGSFNSSLQRYGATTQTGQKDAAKDWADGKLAGMTRDDAASLGKSGELPPHLDPHRSAALAKGSAIAYGRSKSMEWKNHFLTEFKWGNDDPDLWLTEQINKDLSLIGDDKFRKKGYLEGVGNTRDWMLQTQEQWRSNKFIEESKTTAFELFKTGLLTDIGAGVSPSEAADNVRKAYGDLGPSGTLALPRADLDKQIVNLSGTFAREHPEYAKALLTTVRKKDDGRGNLPPLKDTPTFAGRAAEIIRTADNTIFDRKEGVWKETVADNDYKLVQSGIAIDQLEDVPRQSFEGKATSYSAKKRRVAVLARYEQESLEIARDEKDLHGVNKMDRDIRFYASAGAVRDQWKARLQAYPARATVEAIDDPKQRQAIHSDYILYKQLKGKAPGLLPEHTTKESRKFFDNAIIAQDFLKLEEEQAFTMAVDDYNKGEDFDALRPVYAEIDEAIAGFGGWFGDDVVNSTNINGQIRDASRFLTRNGLAPSQAVTVASEHVKATSESINGWYVHTSANTPQFFKESVESMIDSYVDNFGAQEGVDTDDLTIKETSPSVYQLISKSTGVPVLDSDGVVTFRLRDLAARDKSRKSKVRKEIIEDQNSVPFEHRFKKWKAFNIDPLDGIPAAIN